jgi:hypothetical protein
MADEFFLRSTSFILTGFFNMYLKTWDLRLYFPSVLRIFIALKNPTFSAGFELADLGSYGKYAITRPPRVVILMNYPLAVHGLRENDGSRTESFCEEIWWP